MTVRRTLMVLWQCALHGGTWNPNAHWTAKDIREFLDEVANLDADDLYHLRTDLDAITEREERAEYERLKVKYG